MSNGLQGHQPASDPVVVDLTAGDSDRAKVGPPSHCAEAPNDGPPFLGPEGGRDGLCRAGGGEGKDVEKEAHGGVVQGTAGRAEDKAGIGGVGAGKNRTGRYLEKKGEK